MLRDDFLVRTVRAAAEAIARALRRERDVDDATTQDALNEALGEVVRLPVATLVMLDTESMLPLVGGGDPEAARVVARALRGLADIDERAGRDADAKRKRAAAVSIYTRVGLGDDPVDREAARALTAKRT
jgi:hypothetical protein